MLLILTFLIAGMALTSFNALGGNPLGFFACQGWNETWEKFTISRT